MTTVNRSPGEVEADLTEFAKQHRLVLPNPACLKAHTNRFVAVGHCPCVETRPACPCGEALSDIEEMGRCECGILIDPARLWTLKNERNKA